MTEHKHTWQRSTRKHKRPDRFFVQCKDPNCGVVMQATLRQGHLHVFTTSVNRGGKSRVVAYRLHEWQTLLLSSNGVTFVQFVDAAFAKAVKL